MTTTPMSLHLLLRSQLEALREHGFAVKCLCAPGNWVSELRADGFDLDLIKMERELAPLQDVATLGRLVRYLRETKPDIINTHTPKAGLLGPLAARIARVPVIIHTVHGLLFHDEMPLPQQVLGFGAEAFTALSAQYLFFQSREDLETAVKLRFVPRDHAHYIGNGINVEHFRKDLARPRTTMREELNIPESALVIGTVCRLVYEKGLLELIEAASTIRKHHPNAVFVVIGPRELDQNDAVTEADIARAERDLGFRFLGFRKDTRDLYNMMDVFVLPSHREGIPRALMEAAATEVPSVATRIRGIREVVVDGQTGVLVEARNAASLTEGLLRILADPAQRQAWALAGAARIREHFSQKAYDRRVVEGIEQAWRRRKRGH